MADNYFLKMIQTLRLNEEVMLYNNLLGISATEISSVVEFLKDEFTKELTSHPYDNKVLEYNPDAALWAAQTVYLSAQLILYRENKEKDLGLLFPPSTSEINASTILSVDLCLRFVPDLLYQLKLIDSEDGLIEILEKILVAWHYSGIAYPLKADTLDFTPIASDHYLLLIYAQRVIEHRKITLAKHPACKELIRAQLGNYGQDLWNDFILATTTYE
jgi:hypothetical protein